MKKCATSLTLRKIKIKITMTNHLPPLRMGVTRKIPLDAGEKTDGRELVSSVDGSIDQYRSVQPLWKTLG